MTHPTPEYVELIERLHKEAAFVNELAKLIVNAAPANPYAGKPFVITDAAIVMGEAADALEAQSRAYVALAERVGEMEEALAPFAAFADHQDDFRRKDDEAFCSTIIHGGTGERTAINVGHLRAARAALELQSISEQEGK